MTNLVPSGGRGTPRGHGEEPSPRHCNKACWQMGEPPELVLQLRLTKQGRATGLPVGRGRTAQAWN